MKTLSYIIFITILAFLIFGIIWLGGWNFERGPLAAAAGTLWALLSICALLSDTDTCPPTL